MKMKQNKNKEHKKEREIDLQENQNSEDKDKSLVKSQDSTRAFCLGETRQQMTEAQSTAKFKNWCFISSSKI